MYRHGASSVSVELVKYDRAQKGALAVVGAVDIRRRQAAGLGNPAMVLNESDDGEYGRAAKFFEKLIGGVSLARLRRRYPDLSIDEPTARISTRDRAASLDRLLGKLRRKRSVVLVCDCAPHKSHGEVIRRWLLDRV